MPADRKKGRCTKLCAIVFEFHHTPTAISGDTGRTTRIAACSAASATKPASLLEKRQIPVRGGFNGVAANYLWSQLVPLYERELSDFQKRVDAIKRGVPLAEDETSIKPLPAAAFELGGGATSYKVAVGARVFADRSETTISVAPELKGLLGIQISDGDAESGKYQPIEFSTTQPVQVLIGYFNSEGKNWLKPPQLETDALAAERGSTSPLIRNAVAIHGLPPVDVYAQYYPAGRNLLDVHGSGGFIVLGVVPRSVEITPRDAHRVAAN